MAFARSYSMSRAQSGVNRAVPQQDTRQGGRDGAKTQSIQVAVRIRPPSNCEVPQRISVTLSDTSTVTVASSESVYKFRFDQCFDRSHDQQTVYAAVGRPVAKSFLGGVDGCILSYGQTGTGKTFTMYGMDADQVDRAGRCIPSLAASAINGEAMKGLDANQCRGIVPRMVEDIIATLKKYPILPPDAPLLPEGEASADPLDLFGWRLSCSFLEVYNDGAYDLLSDDMSAPPLRITGGDSGTPATVHGRTVRHVRTVADILSVITAGNRNRSSGSTSYNEHSSRSHSIFTLFLQRRAPTPAALAAYRQDRQPVPLDQVRASTSTLHLVDLAGSEKMSAGSVAPAMGDAVDQRRFSELTSINASLSALGNVIRALCAGRGHVPYRDSTLTRILSGALGGNSLTSLICTVSPSILAADETLSTLHFANRAKQIQVHVSRNETGRPQPPPPAPTAEMTQLAERLSQAEAERESLRAKLSETQTQLEAAEQRAAGQKYIVPAQLLTSPKHGPSLPAGQVALSDVAPVLCTRDLSVASRSIAFSSVAAAGTAAVPLLERVFEPDGHASRAISEALQTVLRLAHDALAEMFDEAVATPPEDARAVRRNLEAELVETLQLLGEDLTTAASQASLQSTREVMGALLNPSRDISIDPEEIISGLRGTGEPAQSDVKPFVERALEEYDAKQGADSQELAYHLSDAITHSACVATARQMCRVVAVAAAMNNGDDSYASSVDRLRRGDLTVREVRQGERKEERPEPKSLPESAYSPFRGASTVEEPAPATPQPHKRLNLSPPDEGDERVIFCSPQFSLDLSPPSLMPDPLDVTVPLPVLPERLQTLPPLTAQQLPPMKGVTPLKLHNRQLGQSRLRIMSTEQLSPIKSDEDIIEEAALAASQLGLNPAALSPPRGSLLRRGISSDAQRQILSQITLSPSPEARVVFSRRMPPPPSPL